MAKDDSFNSLSPLLSGFYQRHQIDPQLVEAALVTAACERILEAVFPDRKPFWTIKGFRDPEIIISAAEPVLSQELRNKSTEITQELARNFPQINGFRLRILNKRHPGKLK